MGILVDLLGCCVLFEVFGFFGFVMLGFPFERGRCYYLVHFWVCFWCL